MTSQEFLEILGDVDEKYVLAADDNVVRPRFRWQPWAAAAACAALICVAAWPNFKGGSNGSAGVTADSSADCAAPMEDEAAEAFNNAAVEEPAGVLIQQPGLHDYVLFEGDQQLTFMTTQGALAAPTAPAGGANDAAQEKGGAPEPAPNADAVSGAFEDAPADMPQDVDNPYAGGAGEMQPFIDQNVAIAQYQNLLARGGINEAEGYYPEWYAGAWLDNDWPDHVSRLTVAFADGWRTEAMEDKIRGWCGGTGDVLFCTAKYSYAYLNRLMDEISALFDRYGWLSSVIAPDVTTNRVDLEIFGSTMPSDEFLAELAELDPDGDAIRVQVFTDGTIQFTDDTAMKPPAPAGEPSLALPD